MKLRSIAVALVGATLVGGLVSVPAQAATTRAGRPVATRPADHQGAVARILAALAGHPSGGVPSRSTGVPRAGVITGFVDGASGAPLTGACVVASGPSGSAMAMTQRDGRYVIAPLRAGAYKLHFSDCSAPGRYIDQWSGGAFLAGTASAVTVAAGQVKGVARVTLRSTASAAAGGLGTGAGPSFGIGAGVGSVPGITGPARQARAGTSAILAGTGGIAGTVTGRGKPLKGICVTAYPTARGRGSQVKTWGSGRYRIGGLRPGTYVVYFSACSRRSNWLSQYYPGISSFGRHRPAKVTVTVGKTTRGIDALMRLGGEIDGTVRNTAGKPLANICVESIGRIGRRFVYGNFTRSASDGRFALHALFPASYQLRFSLGCGNPGNYAPMWWRKSFSLDNATKIAIKYGTVVRKIDPALRRGAVISGVVRGASPTGKRLGGICVFAGGLSRNSSFAYTETARDGSYKLIGLTTGRYRVSYQRCRNRGNYLPTRRLVKLTLGHTVAGFEAVLPLGAIVSGVVKDTKGNPVARICVEVNGRRHFGGGRTSSDGSYSINAMPTGNYTVHFAGGCGNAGSYAPQFYRGQTNRASATQVHLTAGRTTGGINATMQPGATVTGAVTDANGNMLSNVCVTVSPILGAQFDFFFQNLSFTRNGVYTAANLAPGLYTVSFGCFFGSGKFARQWFMGQPSAGGANPVSAPAGVITSGIGAVLQPSGTIAGTVTNFAGQPLPRICVEASLRGSTGTVQFFGPGVGVTGPKGGYVLRGLAPGSYAVQFVDCNRSATYGSRWYRRSATAQSSTPVTVTPGGTTTGIDEVLARGGSIAGRVMTSAGMPLPGACAFAFDAATQSFGYSQADLTGRYLITGLSTGSYQLTFYPCRRHKPMLASSTRPGSVQVTAPQAVTGINGKLEIAGSISGIVRATAAATPQAGACVVAVPVDPNGSYQYTLSGKFGGYQLRGLTAGSYQVYFGDPFCPYFVAGTDYAPQWYRNQPTQATAKDVTVSAGADTARIGATLALDGGISGTVTRRTRRSPASA